MRLLKRAILLAVTLTFALILLVRISDLKPEDYVHPGRIARAVRWGPTGDTADELDDKLEAINTTWQKHIYVKEVCLPLFGSGLRTAQQITANLLWNSEPHCQLNMSKTLIFVLTPARRSFFKNSHRFYSPLVTNHKISSARSV